MTQLQLFYGFLSTIALFTLLLFLIKRYLYPAMSVKCFQIAGVLTILFGLEAVTALLQTFSGNSQIFNLIIDCVCCWIWNNLYQQYKEHND